MIHTASPVGPNPAKENEMINTAVNGVKFIMTAAQKYKVKRVVITSDIITASWFPSEINMVTFDHFMWSIADKIPNSRYSEYIKSKILAEKAAWDLQKKWNEDDTYCPELVTILPGFMLGDAISFGPESSVALFRRMISG